MSENDTTTESNAAANGHAAAPASAAGECDTLLRTIDDADFTGEWRCFGHWNLAAFLRAQGFPPDRIPLATRAAASLRQSIQHTRHTLSILSNDHTTVYHIVRGQSDRAASARDAQAEPTPTEFDAPTMAESDPAMLVANVLEWQLSCSDDDEHLLRIVADSAATSTTAASADPPRLVVRSGVDDSTSSQSLPLLADWLTSETIQCSRKMLVVRHDTLLATSTQPEGSAEVMRYTSRRMVSVPVSATESESESGTATPTTTDVMVVMNGINEVFTVSWFHRCA